MRVEGTRCEFSPLVVCLSLTDEVRKKPDVWECVKGVRWGRGYRKSREGTRCEFSPLVVWLSLTDEVKRILMCESVWGCEEREASHFCLCIWWLVSSALMAGPTGQWGEGWGWGGRGFSEANYTYTKHINWNAERPNKDICIFLTIFCNKLAWRFSGVHGGSSW
jgi:hypothetical protein